MEASARIIALPLPCKEYFPQIDKKISYFMSQFSRLTNMLFNRSLQRKEPFEMITMGHNVINKS